LTIKTAEGHQQLVHLGYLTTSDLGSNVVSELLGLFEQDAGVIGVFLRCLYQERGDCVSELAEVGSMWTGLDARRDHCVMLYPIRSRLSARRVCQFVDHLLKFFAGCNCDATTASPVAMAGMIKSSIHHFDGFDGLAGNGLSSGNDGGRAAVCSASLVGAGIDRVETSLGGVSTIWVDCCGGTGGAGCGLSPGSVRVTTGGGDCLAHCNRSFERPGLP